MIKLWHKRILATLAIGGGFVGITLAFATMLSVTSVLNYLFLSLFSCLYFYGIVCGVQLFEQIEPAAQTFKKNRLFWLFQIPVFMTSFLGYEFTSGARFNLWFRLPNKIGLDVNIGSYMQYSLFDAQPSSFGINLFALIICLYFSKLIQADAKSAKVA